MTKIHVSLAAVAAALMAGSLAAQENTPQDRAAPAPLSVELAVTRRAGEKKVDRRTYAFPCQSNERPTVIKSGVEVPVPVRKADAVEYQYRNVGANIECESFVAAGGRYRVRLAFEQSSVLGPNEPGAVARTPETAGAPAFRTTMTRFGALLRPGETSQVVSGADPLTGEMTVLEVTLSSPR